MQIAVHVVTSGGYSHGRVRQHKLSRAAVEREAVHALTPRQHQHRCRRVQRISCCNKVLALLQAGPTGCITRAICTSGDTYTSH